MKKHYRHENDCLNCGSILQGKYCHNCGQENLQIKESFGHMLNHAVSDYFHFDHQFFHTLKPLLLKPGKLTIEYMAGRRAQYLHPVKMYIFISLVYFLLIFKSHKDVINISNNNHKTPTKKELTSNIKKELDKDKDLSEEQKKQALNAAKTYIPNAPVVISQTGYDDDGKKKDTSYRQYIAEQQKLPAEERDGFWQRFYQRKKLTYEEKYGKRGMEMFAEDIKHNMPKMMFVLLPLFALILKITFWRNKKYYVEHLIYAIHLHCFFFLFSAIIILLEMIMPGTWTTLADWLNAFLFFATVWYIYRSLRTMYHRGRWRTVSKMIGMSLMYLIVFSFCMVGLALATAAAAG